MLKGTNVKVRTRSNIIEIITIGFFLLFARVVQGTFNELNKGLTTEEYALGVYDKESYEKLQISKGDDTEKIVNKLLDFGTVFDKENLEHDNQKKDNIDNLIRADFDVDGTGLKPLQGSLNKMMGGSPIGINLHFFSSGEILKNGSNGETKKIDVFKNVFNNSTRLSCLNQDGTIRKQGRCNRVGTYMAVRDFVLETDKTSDVLLSLSGNVIKKFDRGAITSQYVMFEEFLIDKMGLGSLFSRGSSSGNSFTSSLLKGAKITSNYSMVVPDDASEYHLSTEFFTNTGAVTGTGDETEDTERMYKLTKTLMNEIGDGYKEYLTMMTEVSRTEIQGPLCVVTLKNGLKTKNNDPKCIETNKMISSERERSKRSSINIPFLGFGIEEHGFFVSGIDSSNEEKRPILKHYSFGVINEGESYDIASGLLLFVFVLGYFASYLLVFAIFSIIVLQYIKSYVVSKIE